MDRTIQIHFQRLMLERRKKALDDKGKIAAALLTDLSQAFNCLNYEIQTAKLEASSFDNKSLTYILSHLTDRKQRTYMNKSFSTWSSIKSGVPKYLFLGTSYLTTTLMTFSTSMMSTT